MRGKLPLAIALVASALLVGLVFLLVPVRGDMTELLPQGRSPAARLMLDELRAGGAASLVLAGIEGAGEGELAAISRKMAATLEADPRIALVQNGARLPDAAELDSLFARRYLLSPAPAAFSAAALHGDLARLLAALRSAAFPVVARFGMEDPTGAFAAMLAAWSGPARIRDVGGVWFAAGEAAPMAVLLVRTRAGGLDLAAQDGAVGAIRDAFAAARGNGSAKLLLAGPAVFAHDIAEGIAADVRLVSIASAVLVALLLAWRFRSPWAVAAVAVPVLLGVAFAASVTGLRFGFLHGLTLGFGMTMLGVTIDYPVLLVGHRKVGEPEAGTLARIGFTFALAVMTIALGLSGMVFADVPAVAQLGTFAVAGVLGAAAATRFLLPRLIVASGLAPVAAGDPRLLRRMDRLRRLRPAGMAVAAASVLVLLANGLPPLQRDLDSLTPLPPDAVALDARLRAALGVPEPGALAAVRGATEEAVLQRQEALRPALDALVKDGAMEGYEMAATLLPSAATQRARQSALPDAPTLAAALAEARAGLPFTADAFARFAASVEASRTMKPVTRADLASPLAAARLDLLLAPRDGGVLGFIAPRGLHDPARLAAALKDAPDVVFVDIRQETGGLAASYVRTALALVAASAVVAVLALLLALRDPGRLARMVAAVAAALLFTLAAMSLAGARLTLIHLVTLQFVAGLGFDYALFFGRTQIDEEERARTLRTLVTCVAMTLMTFGLLLLCRTPLLHAIGVTVATGAAAAIVFAFLFAPVERSRGGERPA